MNKKLCTTLTVLYHLLFLGGSSSLISGYLDEISKLRVEIVRQADRAEKLVSDAEASAIKVKKDILNAGDSLKKSGDDLAGSISNIKKQIAKIEKACKRFSF